GRLERKPKVLLTGSLIGIYGDRPGELLTEDSPVGEQGFLAILGRDWEDAAAPAADAGIRTIYLRFGLVISPLNAIIRLLMEPIRMGLGVRVRARDTDLSWISMDDALYAIYHLLRTGDVRGPVKVVCPSPVTRRSLLESLARTVSSRVRVTMPGNAVRHVLGAVADEAIFRNQRALPNRLLQSGFTFAFPTLGMALQHQFGALRPAEVESPFRPDALD